MSYFLRNVFCFVFFTMEQLQLSIVGEKNSMGPNPGGAQIASLLEGTIA